jgi:hypothetical protein
MKAKHEERGSHPAFPINPETPLMPNCDGLTIREYMAAAVLPALVTTLRGYGVSRDADQGELAARAVELADELLLALAAKEAAVESLRRDRGDDMIDLAPITDDAIQAAYEATKKEGAP